MNVVFRADASLDIGSGHVMRCLALACELRRRGASCHFICRENEGHLLGHIGGLGFSASALPGVSPKARPDIGIQGGDSGHASWLGVEWQSDASATGAILSEIEPDWLVVDHYGLDRKWEQALIRHCRQLFVIDDLADRAHVCNVLLDQNLGRESGDYVEWVPPGCRLLIGPEFALLRPEFAAMRRYSLARRRHASLRHLLITMGGVDKPNATGVVLGALRDCGLPSDCRITVVMGGMAPWLEQVRTLASALPWSTEVRVNIDDMARVMADSDLAIGAAGSTSWERCCLGLPSVLAVLADNQERIARALEERGAAIDAGGTGAPTFAARVCGAIQRLLSHPGGLQSMAQAAAEVTLGTGADKTAASLWDA